MSEKTIIFDGNNPEIEHKEQARIVTSRIFQNNVRERAQSQKNVLRALRNVGLAIGGLGSGMALMGFMPSHPLDEEVPIPIPENPEAATTVTDKMSYQEAFQAAREELGAGHYFTWRGNTFSTYTQEEWSRLDDEDKADYQECLNEQTSNHEHIESLPFVVHDQAPIAENVSDDMSFNDAFAIARQEVGPGGVFEWHGKLYATYYKTEWDNMDESERHQFAESIEQSDMDSNNINPSQMDNISESVSVNESSAEVFLTDEYIDLENGETLHIGYFQQGAETIMKLDVDGDSQYDYIIDTKAEQLIGLNGNADIDFNELINNDPTTPQLQEPVISEYVDVDGYNALVTTFTDGTQQAQVDLDGDGIYDTTLTLNSTTGEINAYDTNGNLIAQDTIPDYNAMGQSDVVLEDNLYGDYEHSNDLYTDNYPENFGNDFNNQSDINDWA
ncbi:hypothetical protein [Tannerella forsythia]|uniref:Uncharacterized protein n=1 Tax=Tannerella forsythia TaxID=28112 RepID=A0A3P1XN72_TANFO|nr:hypothetical protein [Tannerella forsythia]RRD58353.1 hypothetical protein EII40_12075 [Tannerella forsythia]